MNRILPNELVEICICALSVTHEHRRWKQITAGRAMVLTFNTLVQSKFFILIKSTLYVVSDKQLATKTLN